jgi:hypothetical protein
MDQIPDEWTPRPALYYPYIHIRSERWLKATLLCMPTVKRIVPDDYTPEDEPAITPYTTITGPYGKLLQTVPAYTPATDHAQRRLLNKIVENARTIDNKYSRPIREFTWPRNALAAEVAFCPASGGWVAHSDKEVGR